MSHTPPDPRRRSRSRAMAVIRNCAWLPLSLCLLGLLPGASPAKSETAATPSPLTRSSHNPAARLPEGDSASEYWDVTIKLDSGHHIVARFIITNVGFGDRNGIAFGHLVHPDGSRVAFRNGKLQGRWRLTGNDQNLDIGGCHLFMEANPYRFWINKDDVKIDLRFAPNFALATPAAATPDGYHLDVLSLAAPVAGTLWFGDEAAPRSVDGQASLVHTWTRENEAKQVTRRIDFYGFQPEPSFVVTFLAPSGPQTQWLAAPSEEGTWRSTTQFHANPVGHLDGIEREGYPVPRRVELTGTGAAGQIQLSQTVLEADPLGGLAFPLRWMASRGMRPHRVWAQVAFDVTLPPNSTSPPQLLQGTGIAALTFLNPLNHH